MAQKTVYIGNIWTGVADDDWGKLLPLQMAASSPLVRSNTSRPRLVSSMKPSALMRALLRQGLSMATCT